LFAPKSCIPVCVQVGELAEIFQWRGEVAAGLPGFSQVQRQHTAAAAAAAAQQQQ
jgi:hypothetical protein